MTLVTEKPEDLTPQNDLDDIEDPDEPELNQHGLSIDRYLAFGTTPRALPNPPKDGEVVVYQVKVECVGQAHKRRTDGEVRYRSELEILSVARIDEDLPPDFKSKKQLDAEAKAAAKEAAKGKGLYDDPDAPPIPGTGPDDQAEGETPAPESTSGVENPTFSHDEVAKKRRGRGRKDPDPTGALEHAAEQQAEGNENTGQQYRGWQAIEAAPSVDVKAAACAFLARAAWPNENDEHQAKWAPKIATDAEIGRNTFRQAMAKAHPDRNGGDQTLWDQVEQAGRILGLTQARAM